MALISTNTDLSHRIVNFGRNCNPEKSIFPRIQSNGITALYYYYYFCQLVVLDPMAKEPLRNYAFRSNLNRRYTPT